MKIIHTALAIEARPFIDMLSLKRQRLLPVDVFPVYCNSEYILVISGTGKVAAGASIAAVLASFHTTGAQPWPGPDGAGRRNSVQTVPAVAGGLPGGRAQEVLLVNCGLCGAPPGSFDAGEIIMANKIMDAGNNRAYYPDCLVPHSFKEATCVTGDMPYASTASKEERLTARNREGVPDYHLQPGSNAGEDRVCDMEASGVAQVALAFLGPHQLCCLKTVSDHGEGVRLDKAEASRLMARLAPRAVAHLGQPGKHSGRREGDAVDGASGAAPLPPDDSLWHAAKRAVDSLRLTVSQQQRLSGRVTALLHPSPLATFPESAQPDGSAREAAVTRRGLHQKIQQALEDAASKGGSLKHKSERSHVFNELIHQFEEIELSGWKDWT